MKCIQNVAANYIATHQTRVTYQINDHISWSVRLEVSDHVRNEVEIQGENKCWFELAEQLISDIHNQLRGVVL